MPALCCGRGIIGCTSEGCRRRSFGSLFPSLALLVFSALHLLLASIAYSRCGALPTLSQNLSSSSRLGHRPSSEPDRATTDRQQRLQLRAKQLEWEITRLRRELKSTTRAILDVEQLCSNGGASRTNNVARVAATETATTGSGNWAGLRSHVRLPSLLPSLADRESVHSTVAPKFQNSRESISTLRLTKRRMYNEFEVTPLLYFDENAFTLLYNAERAVTINRQRILADEQFQRVLDMAQYALQSDGSLLGTSTTYSGQQQVLHEHHMTNQTAGKERSQSYVMHSSMPGVAVQASTYSAALAGGNRPQLRCSTPCHGSRVATENTPHYVVNFVHAFYGVVPQVGILYEMMFTKDSTGCVTAERSQGTAAERAPINGDRQLFSDFTSDKVGGTPLSTEGDQCSSTALGAVSVLQPYGSVRVTQADVVQIVPRHLVVVVVQGSDPDDEIPVLMSKFVEMFNNAWLGKDHAGSNVNFTAGATSKFGNNTTNRAGQEATVTQQTGKLVSEQQQQLPLRNWTPLERSTLRGERNMPKMSTERAPSFSKNPTMWNSVSLLIVVESKRAELLTRRATAEGKLLSPGNQQLNAERTMSVTVAMVPRNEPASSAMHRIVRTLQPTLQRNVPNLTRLVETHKSAATRDTVASEKQPLVLVTDMRATFTADFLVRCAINSSPGRRVYYPIPFRLYNGNLTQERPTPATQHSLGTENTISKFRGFWHVADHGTSCSHWQDFLKAVLPSAGNVEQQASKKKRSFYQRGGNRDTWRYAESAAYVHTAPRWLGTLFRLHAKASNLSVIRVPDPALVQPYRPIDCSARSPSQEPADSSPPPTLLSCWHSRAALEASHAQLGLLAFSDEIAQRQLTCCRRHEKQNAPTDVHKHRRKQSDKMSTERRLTIS